MSLSVGHKLDLISILASFRTQLIEQRANGFDQVEIATLRAGTKQQGRTGFRCAGFNQTACMVFDIEPVANILTVAINRDRCTQHSFANDRGDQFLAILPRPVIIGAICDDSGQAIGSLPGPGEMVAGGLAGRIGRGRFVGGVLVKQVILGAEVAEHFIGGHMDEPEPLRRASIAPMRERGFKQAERAVDIGLHECAGAIDRAINMSLGGEMNHRVRARRLEQGRNCLVEIENLMSGFAELANHGRADESIASGNDIAHRNSCLSSARALSAA